MGADLRLANDIWRTTQEQAKKWGHDPDRIDYYTVVMVVATLLADEELCGRLMGEFAPTKEE